MIYDYKPGDLFYPISESGFNHSIAMFPWTTDRTGHEHADISDFPEYPKKTDILLFVKPATSPVSAGITQRCVVLFKNKLYCIMRNNCGPKIE